MNCAEAFWISVTSVHLKEEYIAFKFDFFKGFLANTLIIISVFVDYDDLFCYNCKLPPNISYYDLL